MTDRPQYRTGTSSLTLPAALTQAQLGDGIREALQAELAETGEWLAQYDYGPPHRAGNADMRSYDVMYRTGPEHGGATGPGNELHPRLDA
jgi:hypothetical protein